MKILIAEDNPIIQMINSELMNEWGFCHDTASNGIEAIDFAIKNNGEYDLCLMDVEMPEIDGIEATKTIRRVTHYFPILALTSNIEYRKACLDIGMDEFLEKPCPPELLLKTINELAAKKIIVDYNDANIVSIREGTPMNHDELQELRALKSRGLTKLKLVGIGHTFIVHKNIQNKISHDLIGDSKELSEFIDRSPLEPGRCHLYKANLHVTKDMLLPEELDEAIRKEDEVAMRFIAATDRRASD